MPHSDELSVGFSSDSWWVRSQLIVHARVALSACPTNRATPSYARLVEGIHVAVKRSNVEHPIDHRWREIDDEPGGEAPQRQAGCGVEGIHMVVLRANVEHAISYRWGGLDDTPSSEAPQLCACRSIKKSA